MCKFYLCEVEKTGGNEPLVLELRLAVPTRVEGRRPLGEHEGQSPTLVSCFCLVHLSLDSLYCNKISF